MKDTAKEYWLQGCNIILLSGKQPLQKWERWQSQAQTLDEFESLPWSKAEMFAVVCGLKLNNGLYFGAIDVDVKKVPEEAVQRGKEFEKQLRTSQTEVTPSRGKHFIYFSKTPIRSVSLSSIREFCGVELLGENRLCIMSPSKGYVRLNDNTPTQIASLNELFDKTLRAIGYKTPGVIQQPTVEFHGKTRFKIRPCVKALFQKPHLTHEQRVIITTEYSHAGYDQEDIEALFRNKADVDMFKEKETHYQVHHIVGKPYFRYSCSKLEAMGLCLPGCSIAKKEFEKWVESL